MDNLIAWISSHYFEVIAAGLGFIAIYLQIRQNVWYWLVSIIMVSMYIYIYIDARLYADMSLQVYYLVVSFYGWYNWLYGSHENQHRTELKVTKATGSMLLSVAVVSILLFVAMAWFLLEFTDSDLPYWDSFTTSLSFVATWMLAKKILENWLFWIIVDAVSVGIYIYKGLLPTAVLFAFLTVFAVVGYQKWKRNMYNIS